MAVNMFCLLVKAISVITVCFSFSRVSTMHSGEKDDHTVGRPDQCRRKHEEAPPRTVANETLNFLSIF